MIRTCTKCNKPQEFRRPKGWCKPCTAEWVKQKRATNSEWRDRQNQLQRERHARNPKRYTGWDKWKQNTSSEYRRNNYLVKRYGITCEQYERILNSQDGVCAACKGPPNGRGKANGVFYVDHDHVIDQVRGLLCHSCNAALGYVKEDLEVLEALTSYIRKYKWLDDG